MLEGGDGQVGLKHNRLGQRLGRTAGFELDEMGNNTSPQLQGLTWHVF